MKNQKQFNEKPCKYKNLGQDILGAKRHNFNTYESEEKKIEREKIKKSKIKLKNLKDETIKSLDETNYVLKIQSYELNKNLEFFEGFNSLKTDPVEVIKELRIFVLSKRGSENFNKLASKFNRVNSVIHKLKYKIKSLENAKNYFEIKSKNKFQEVNGIQRPWALESKFDAKSIKYLSQKTQGIQFGNSLTEREREYCMNHLSDSIKILEKYFDFDFKKLSFAFGARGKIGSIAHYEHTNNTIAFNRGWDGCLIHELGHAFDYNLYFNVPISKSSLPHELKKKYFKKLDESKQSSLAKTYYRKPVEIFARLFEVYCRSTIPELTNFMQFTFDESVMPDLDSEALEYMNKILMPYLRKKETES